MDFQGRRRNTALLLTAGVLSLHALTPAAAFAATQADSGDEVEITVVPDVPEPLQEGDEVTYEITVTNHGEDLGEAELHQLLPAGMESVDSEPEAELEVTSAIWELSLDAGEDAVFHHTVEVTSAEAQEEGQLIEVEQEDVPEQVEQDGLFQYQSNACLYAEAGGSSLACAPAWESFEEASADEEEAEGPAEDGQQPDEPAEEAGTSADTDDDGLPGWAFALIGAGAAVVIGGLLIGAFALGRRGR